MGELKDWAVKVLENDPTWGAATSTRPAAQPSTRSTRRKPAGPDVDQIWATALDSPPVRQEPAGFDYRPTQMTVIQRLIEAAHQWGDRAVSEFLDRNPDRWPVVWQQLRETERLITDCHPDADRARVTAAARLATIAWIEFRLLEKTTITEFRARLAQAWKRLQESEE
ncbi:MAG TPA: hypothetical protein PLQ35_14460 [bacterium]|nr:hypothetical protein [bacterium]